MEDQRITELLKKIKNEEGRSLFDHFCELFYQYNYEPNHYYKDPQFFEKLSQFVKRYGFTYQNPKTSEEVNQTIKLEKKRTTSTQYKIQNIIMQPFSYQNQILTQAGWGFSDTEAYMIQQSLKGLAQPNFSMIRFWGKMLTNGKDYYVAEVKLLKPYQEDLPDDSEPIGTGVNEYIHYVTQNLSDEWCLLPAVTRKQLELSRFIKYIFTGDLNRSIKAYPHFPGQEKHLLKAQIVRITHANLIAPNGCYKTNDENGNFRYLFQTNKAKLIEFAEEYKLQEMSELQTLEAWVHVGANILKLGRITHYVDPNLSEEAKSQKLEELANEDPELDRLKGISEDKPVEPYETGWLIKVVGETQQYTGLDDSAVSYATVILRNYLWPGALTVSNRNMWVNIYIGYGQKNSQAPFVPIAPNDIMEEPDEIEEFPEPNPQTLADELEPDSDDERRRQQELLEQQQND